MNIIIQSIHFKADSKLKDYIEKKLTKLETFYSGIIDATSFLKSGESHLKKKTR